MPSVRVAPYRQIAHEVASRLAMGRVGLDPLAPWQEAVLVPTRGVAEQVALELARRLPGGFAGLRIESLESLARRILNAAGEMPRTATDAERRLAMRASVRAIADPMMESRGIASMLERSHRDVRDGGVAVAAIVSRATRDSLRNRRRTETVAGAWVTYERLVAQLRAIDPAELLLRAARAVTGTLPPQLLAGFYDMTGAQFALVEALVAAGRIERAWVPSDAPFARPLLERLGAAGSYEVSDLSPPGGAPVLHTVRYDTRIDELRGACEGVAALLATGVPAREIGITGRALDAHDVRLLTRFAGDLGFRISLREEIPLRAHRIGRGAVTLLRLRERGFLRAEILELVRDGFLTSTHIQPDAVDSETRRARIAGGTSAELGRIRVRSRAIDDYIALVSELERTTASIDEDFLSRLGSMFRVESETDLAAAAKLDEIAALFRRASAWGRPLDIPSVIDAIEREQLPRAAAGAAPEVWAGDVMRLRGRAFTYLFVVRMQDDVFPQRRIEDPILPDSDRRVLGLREIGDGRDEEQLLFSLLGDAAPQVRFSYATSDGFGRILRPSRLLRGLTETLPAPSPARERPAASRRQLQMLARRGSRGVFDGEIGPLGEALRVRVQALSPTQLEDFGECPQKFLFKHILDVVDIDHPEHELQINIRDKGTIDHRILERFYRTMGPEEIAAAAAALPRLPATLVARIEAIVDEQFDDLGQLAPPFNPTVRDIERRATKRLLRDFVAADVADLASRGLLPSHFEYRFGRKHRTEPDHPEPFVLEAGGSMVRVEGTIDRIDSGGGRLRIVDYKSGKALRHQNLGEKIDRGVRLQLALYAMAVAAIFDTEPPRISGTIKPLVVSGKDGRFEFELEEKRTRLFETLEIFLRAIHGGSFPAFPTGEGKELDSCKYCPVNHSCRTRHDPWERYAVQQLGDPRTLLSRAIEVGGG